MSRTGTRRLTERGIRLELEEYSGQDPRDVMRYLFPKEDSTVMADLVSYVLKHHVIVPSVHFLRLLFS